ncbi:MAG: MFS transporter [Rhodobacteraceae bacterium]|nr:MFS transporter [Paracoccaceae bacterium]
MMLINRARAATGYSFFVLGSLLGSWASRIPDIQIQLSVSEADFGLLLLAMAIGAVVSLPLSGTLMGRFGAARMTKIFGIVVVVLFAAVPLISSFLAILPLVLAIGFAMGTLDVSMNGWGAEVEEDIGRSVMQSFHGLYSLGAAVGAGVGALTLMLEWSTTLHFAVWTVIVLVPQFLVVQTHWCPVQLDEELHTGSLFAIPKGALLYVGLMALAAALAEGANTDWAALYQIRELGIDPADAATSFSVFSVAMLALRMFGDRLVERFGAVLIARISGVLACVGAVMLVYGGGIWTIWTALAIMGVGNALIFPLAISRAAMQPGVPKGVAIASVATLGYGAFLLGPPLLGFVAELVSLRAVFVIVVFVGFLVPLFAGWFEKPVRAKP